MYKTSVTYTDFNGETQTDQLYFNLTSIDIAKLTKRFGNVEQYLTDVMAEHNGLKIISVMADLVLDAYGEVSVDGKHFDKSPRIKENFENSIAYAEYLEKMVSSGDEATRWVTNVLSSKVMNEAMDQAKESTLTVVPKPVSAREALDNLSEEELEALLSKKHEQ